MTAKKRVNGKRAAQVIDGEAVAVDQAEADAAEAVAEEAKTLPWRCVTCWRAGRDVQLADKDQSDPTGRKQCPEGHSWWGKTGLDA